MLLGIISFTGSYYMLNFGISNGIRMIITFGNHDSEDVWLGNWVKRLPMEIQNRGRRKLRMLNNSHDIADLRIPPGNRLEKLSGKWRDFYSIRINDQWRIIFKWEGGNAFEVEITDYH